MSPSLRGRGLKSASFAHNRPPLWSPSLRGRGLKCNLVKSTKAILTSPSLRGRGLKCKRKKYTYSAPCRPLCEGVDWNRQLHRVLITSLASPSLRGRGLKCYHHTAALHARYVALFARAWIEIFYFHYNLWLLKVALFARAWIEIRSVAAKAQELMRRPLCEGVDWNRKHNFICKAKPCRPLCEGVDWNKSLAGTDFEIIGRPLCEGVDWNSIVSRGLFYFWVALFARAWIEIPFGSFERW